MNKTLREHINQHPDIQNGRAIAILWDINDIKELESKPGVKFPINDREATEILNSIQDTYDPSYGIMWDDLFNAVEHYIRQHPRATCQAETGEPCHPR